MTPPWTAANRANKTDVVKSISDFLFSFLEGSDSFVRRDFFKRVSLTSPILNLVSVVHSIYMNLSRMNQSALSYLN